MLRWGASLVAGAVVALQAVIVSLVAAVIAADRGWCRGHFIALLAVPRAAAPDGTARPDGAPDRLE